MGGFEFPQSYVQILASSACERGLIWERVFALSLVRGVNGEEGMAGPPSTPCTTDDGAGVLQNQGGTALAAHPAHGVPSGQMLNTCEQTLRCLLGIHWVFFSLCLSLVKGPPKGFQGKVLSLNTSKASTNLDHN